ncbi:hypothetical protein EDD85DRAFT_943580 [Armillaria nabsnona]|nr:hypothetical protein EDD85DRAFT_943580 [Armillaria nabsnona]
MVLENLTLWMMGMRARPDDLIGLAVFAGDQLRRSVIVTGIGLLNGLVAWYIGTARGNGNPYCVVIIATALTAPFVLKGITCHPSDKAFWKRTSFLAKERKTQLNGDLEKRHKNGSTKEERIWTFTPRMLAISPTLTAAQSEARIRGQWPYEQYTLLHSKWTRLLSTLNLLVGALSRMDERWCGILVHHTPFMNPSFLPFRRSSFASRVSQPEGSDHLSRASFEGCSAETCRYKRDGDSVSSDSDVEDSTDLVPEKVDDIKIGIKELTIRLLIDPHLPAHSTGEHFD